MPDTALLQDLLVVFGLGVAMVVLFHRFNLPSVLGFLITGVVLGPYGLKMVEQTNAIQSLAEVGLVLLLFEAGIEFSVKTFLRIKKFLLFAGTLQILLTIAATAVCLKFLGLALNSAVFIGMLVSLSSTALVIRIMEYRGDLDSVHGKSALSILIFQDLCIVPMVLVTPYLAGSGGDPWPVLETTGKALLFVALAASVARFLIPWALNQVARIKKREAFVLTVMLLCLGTATATSHFGLSMALGAFIAGLIISDSEYSHQALAEILPIREILNCLVFVSIGMLFDLRVLIAHPWLVLSLLVAMMSVKTLVGFTATFAMGHSWRVALLTGVIISQASEFSFVLSKIGFNAGIVDNNVNQLFLAVAILSMFVTPGAISTGSAFQKLLDRIIPSRWGAGRIGAGADARKLTDHTIIAGYGLAGRNLAASLTAKNIPFMVIEYDPMVVHANRETGLNIMYGDASRPEVLKHAGIDRARAVVFTMSDPDLLLVAVELAHRLKPDQSLLILARARYANQIAPLEARGAHSIVAEEVSGSYEISSQILTLYAVPEADIESTVTDIHIQTPTE
jgi:monovalent cation:H+ antiporter-2, CPA2 family